MKPDDSTTDDPRLVEVIQDYERELDAGRRPDRQRFINRYPELAHAVADCLDGLDMLRQGLPERSDVGATQADGMSRGSSSTQSILGRLPNPLGDFQIVRELARGGMGIVYEAIQLSLCR